MRLLLTGFKVCLTVFVAISAAWLLKNSIDGKPRFKTSGAQHGTVLRYEPDGNSRLCHAVVKVPVEGSFPSQEVHAASRVFFAYPRPGAEVELRPIQNRSPLQSCNVNSSYDIDAFAYRLQIPLLYAALLMAASVRVMLLLIRSLGHLVTPSALSLGRRIPVAVQRLLACALSASAAFITHTILSAFTVETMQWGLVVSYVYAMVRVAAPTMAFCQVGARLWPDYTRNIHRIFVAASVTMPPIGLTAVWRVADSGGFSLWVVSAIALLVASSISLYHFAPLPKIPEPVTP